MTSHWSIFGRPNYLLEELHWEPEFFVVCLTFHFLRSKANWWFGCCLFLFLFWLVLFGLFVCVLFGCLLLLSVFTLALLCPPVPRPWVPNYCTFCCIHNDCHYRHDGRRIKKNVVLCMFCVFEFVLVCGGSLLCFPRPIQVRECWWKCA